MTVHRIFSNLEPFGLYLSSSDRDKVSVSINCFYIIKKSFFHTATVCPRKKILCFGTGEKLEESRVPGKSLASEHSNETSAVGSKGTERSNRKRRSGGNNCPSLRQWFKGRPLIRAASAENRRRKVSRCERQRLIRNAYRSRGECSLKAGPGSIDLRALHMSSKFWERWNCLNFRKVT